MPDVKRYKIRLTYWTPEGWRMHEITTEGSRPTVAIKRAIDYSGEAAKSIVRIDIIDGPPNYKLPARGSTSENPIARDGRLNRYGQ